MAAHPNPALRRTGPGVEELADPLTPVRPRRSACRPLSVEGVMTGDRDDVVIAPTSGSSLFQCRTGDNEQSPKV